MLIGLFATDTMRSQIDPLFHAAVYLLSKKLADILKTRGKGRGQMSSSVLYLTKESAHIAISSCMYEYEMRR